MKKLEGLDTSSKITQQRIANLEKRLAIVEAILTPREENEAPLTFKEVVELVKLEMGDTE